MGLRVKQLEWSRCYGSSSNALTADPMHAHGYEIWAVNGKWFWCETQNEAYEGSNGMPIECESCEDGQRQCQEHWESQEGIGKCLETITEPESSPGSLLGHSSNSWHIMNIQTMESWTIRDAPQDAIDAIK